MADRLSGDNKYSCDGCKRKVNALKTTCIESLPNILIIDFVRYNLGRKNTEIISYPKTLRLSKFTSESIDEANAKKIKSKSLMTKLKNAVSKEDNNKVYDLYGLIVHQGSSRQFGHYFSYCRGFEPGNTWYKCNDESTTRLSGIDAALNKEAYILFY